MKRNKHSYDGSMWKGAPSEHFSRAQRLRENMTVPERVLWEKLQFEPFKEFHFRRQHPIHVYIVDFYSHSLKLVIEIDGNYHESESQKILDAERSKMLELQGLKVIRFPNSEVVEKTDDVLKRIKSSIGLL